MAIERYTAPSAGRGSSVQLLATGRNDGEWVRFTDHQAALSAVTAENDRLREAAQYLASWDHCWPGNINLETAAKMARAALTSEDRT